MKQELNFWVVGGDLRQGKLAELLAEDGHTVHTYGLEELPEGSRFAAPDLRRIARADCVVLPLPAMGEEGCLNAPLARKPLALKEVLDGLHPDQVLCAGRVTPELTREAERRGLTVRDYFAREELAVANAVPTALAMGHRGTAI